MSAINETVTAWWPVLVGVWGLVSSALGLYAKWISSQLVAVSAKHDKLDEAFNNYREQVARTYMPASDIKELVADLKAYLVRIEDKVDGGKS